jgi:CBS domain-containing protein
MMLKEIMKKELVTISSEMSVRDAAMKMKEKDVGCLLVSENGRLNGILTDRDIACKVVANGKDTRYTMVKDIMKTDVVFSTPETNLSSF